MVGFVYRTTFVSRRRCVDWLLPDPKRAVLVAHNPRGSCGIGPYHRHAALVDEACYCQHSSEGGKGYVESLP